MMRRPELCCIAMAQPDADRCFSPLRTPAAGLLNHCQELIANPERLWWPHYGFLATPLSSSWIEEEPALREVQQITPIARLGILKLPALWVYSWHRDQTRQACINLLLSRDHHSHTLFGEPVNSTTFEALELCYPPSRYVLFNNQVPHTVINLDRDRYLLSLEFSEPTPYEELRSRFLAAGLLETSVSP
jgi:hypothetical protein